MTEVRRCDRKVEERSNEQKYIVSIHRGIDSLARLVAVVFDLENRLFLFFNNFYLFYVFLSFVF